MTRTAILALALVAALGSMQVGAQRRVSGGPSGFRALGGASAAAFAMPDDMRLVARERVGRGGSIDGERYRQFIGNAEVLGAQITVYRDDPGGRNAVIGAHYPDLVPANAVRLSAAGAQAIAASRRDARGAAWQTALMIHPDTARYFYRVESRGFGARWFYWIDAESGAVINEYDGLTTGSGVGVLGDVKLFRAGLTTKQKGSYRMVSSDNRLKTYDARNRSTLPGSIATDTNDNWDRLGRTSPGQPALGTLAVAATYAEGAYAANVADAWDEVGVDDTACVGGGGSGSDTTPPVITAVEAIQLPPIFFPANWFQIDWYTDEFADSVIEFRNGPTYADPALTDFHAMWFSGTMGATYEYRVHSTDASGNAATSPTTGWCSYTVGTALAVCNIP